MVTLRNDSTIEHALETLWRAITPLATQPTPSGDSASDTPQNVQMTLPEDGARPSLNVSRISPAEPTVVYDTYWSFAVERQEVFLRRLEGCPPPWTHDSILHHYKFPNAYRASDRVSQYLIRNVIYEGPQSPEGIFFRTLLFKIFNRIETWELLKAKLGMWTTLVFVRRLRQSVVQRARGRSRHLLSGLHDAVAGARLRDTPKSIVTT